MAALLQHLGEVGFDFAPRYLGRDREGRVMVDYVEGDVFDKPPWQEDDAANAHTLGEMARCVKALHTATVDFAPPAGESPMRQLPISGATWTHGDVGYSNVVFRGGAVAALIDWEFAAPGDRLVDLGGLLGVCARGPKPGVDDNPRRAEALDRAAEEIAGAYGLGQVEPLYRSAAVVLDDAADYWEEIGLDRGNVEVARWRSAWLKEERWT